MDHSAQVSTEKGIILAIDYGQRRTGLARSDAGRAVAFGLSTFVDSHGAGLRDHLRSMHADEPITGVVIGLPLNMDGTGNGLTARVRDLAAWIRSEMGLPVALWDERLTSAEAAEMLREAPARIRRQKGSVDRIAAQIILREFLAAGCPFPADAETG